MRLGYVLKMFPRLSETFILNELLELERRGIALSVYSLLRPDDGRFHGRLAELRLRAEYFPREKPEALWRELRQLPAALRPEPAGFEEAADFLERHRIVGDLDLLFRAALIAGRAREQRVEHLHAHFGTVAARVAALVGMMTGIPFSFTAHAKDIFREGVSWELFGELLQRAAFCVTVSDFNRSWILERAPRAEPSKVIRLYNGVDLGYLQASGPRVDGDVPRVVSVGRLVPKKGFDCLLAAVRICLDRGLHLQLDVIGDGPERDALVTQRERFELENHVNFCGALPQEQVLERIAAASFVALACVPDSDGNMDALPTVLLEALALDIPVVSTRLAGIPEIVGEDVGVLVEPGDAAALAAAMESLWRSLRGGRPGAGACRRRCERLFDLRTNVGALAGLFARGCPSGVVA